MHGFGQVLDIAGSDTGHGDAAVLGEVDVEFLCDPLDLPSQEEEDMGGGMRQGA